MKKGLLFVLLVVGFFGMDFLGRIHASEPVKAGEELELFINVNNPLDKNFDDISVKAVFFDLGEYLISPEFKLGNFEKEGVHLFLDIPKNTPKGDYILRVITSSEDIHDSKNIFVRVI